MRFPLSSVKHRHGLIHVIGVYGTLGWLRWLYSSGFVEMHEVPDHRLRERHLQDAVDVKHGLTRQPARAVKTTDL